MAKSKTSDNTNSGKVVNKRKKFIKPVEAADKAIDAALLAAAQRKKSTIGPHKRSNPRAAWLRGKIAVLRRAKAAKVPDKEIIEIFKSQGVEISLPTLRAFMKNADKRKKGKSSDKENGEHEPTAEKSVGEGQDSKPEEKVDHN